MGFATLKCTLVASGSLAFSRVSWFILGVVLQCEVCCHGAEERDHVSAAVHSAANEEERHGVSKHQDRR